MIRNIVFDMGNVLLHFDPAQFIRRAGVENPADAALLQQELFRSLEWVQMDRGSLTEQGAFERIRPRLPQRLHAALEKLLFCWDEPILPVAGMAQLVKDCRAAGYGVYLLSNASRRLHDYFDRVPGSEWFQGRFVSADHGLVKPQQSIYRAFCGRFGLRGGECLFVDDVPLNIEGAVTAGWQGIVFCDAQDLRRKMRAMGISLPQRESGPEAGLLEDFTSVNLL